uniref:Secreted protein n=1 Tax=Octopus bimaculoides TaxID=37653 RepID=A0A0L8HZA0_OCTBM
MKCCLNLFNYFVLLPCVWESTPMLPKWNTPENSPLMYNKEDAIRIIQSNTQEGRFLHSRSMWSTQTSNLNKPIIWKQKTKK